MIRKYDDRGIVEMRTCFKFRVNYAVSPIAYYTIRGSSFESAPRRLAPFRENCVRLYVRQSRKHTKASRVFLFSVEFKGGLP